MLCASGEAGGGAGTDAQGPAVFSFFFLFAAAAAAEVKVDAEAQVAELEGELAGAAADAAGLATFWGGTPKTSTWSAQKTALTPSMAKPMARSRMKTVADSAEAEGVCFFFFFFLEKKIADFFSSFSFALLAVEKKSSPFSYHRIDDPEVAVGQAQLHREHVPVGLYS